MQSRAVSWTTVRQHKGAIFDWLVFIISFLLGLSFPALKDVAVSGKLSELMLVCLVLYSTGVALKRAALFYRCAQEGRAVRSIGYLLFLIIGHWLIMLAAVTIADSAFRRIIGLPPAAPDSVSGMEVFLNISAAIVITWFVYRRGRAGKRKHTERFLFWRELAADLLLITAVSMLSFIFWEKSIFVALSHMSMQTFGDIFFLFVFLVFAYLLFYLPLRYLYLLEDNSGAAWKRLRLIFLLILVRGVFEMLRI